MPPTTPEDALEPEFAAELLAAAPTPTTVTPTPTPTPSETPRILTAVLIETSLSPALVPVLVHFAAVLGPHWQIVLFTSALTWTEHPKSTPFQRLLASKQLSVRYIPDDVQLTDSKSVSSFLVRPWLWEELIDSHRVLLFQLDSIICANANQTVDDFLEWDYVGAPIDGRYGAGYNGGLSIRNPRLFLDIVKRTGGFANGKVEFEDQWFYKQARSLEAEQEVRLPDPETAQKFAVETIYYEKPLGYHQPTRWQKDRMSEIEEWCPEVKMLIGRRAT